MMLGFGLNGPGLALALKPSLALTSRALGLYLLWKPVPYWWYRKQPVEQKMGLVFLSLTLSRTEPRPKMDLVQF